MITIFDKKFAANDKEAVESLFDPTGTVCGFYKVYARKIMIYNLQNEPIGFINRHLLFGNAFVQNGKTYYQAGMPSNHILYNESMLANHNEALKFVVRQDSSGAYFN